MRFFVTKDTPSITASSPLPNVLEVLEEVWASLLRIDPEFHLHYSDKISPKVITPRLEQLFLHCCRQRHYFFEIKKCGNEKCSICETVKLSADEFTKLKLFHDPVY